MPVFLSQSVLLFEAHLVILFVDFLFQKYCSVGNPLKIAANAKFPWSCGVFGLSLDDYNYIILKFW